MTWLLLALLGYALFAVNSVGDKYLLANVIQSPLQFTFHVGMLGGLVILFVPFFGFPLPELHFLVATAFSGIVFIAALAIFYRTLAKHESSRIIPAIGGFLPLFTLLLAFFIFPHEPIGYLETLSLCLFIVASITVSSERGKKIFSKGLDGALFSAFLFALYFVSMKYVYSLAPFWDGLLWTKIWGVLAAIGILIFSRSVRTELFMRKNRSAKVGLSGPKPIAEFLGIQGAGAAASVLQSGAVYIAPPSSVAIVNALQGTQFLFVELFVFILSVKFPTVIKESFSGKTGMKKIFASLLFIIGIGLLLFNP